jgi:hypothetical protein
MMLLNKSLRAMNDVPGLVLKKTRGVDFLLKGFGISAGIIFGRLVFPKKRGRHQIDAFVRALGRKDCGNHKL